MKLLDLNIPYHIRYNFYTVLSFITTLMCERIMKASSVTIEEWVYEPYYNEHGYPDFGKLLLCNAISLNQLSDILLEQLKIQFWHRYIPF